MSGRAEATATMYLVSDTVPYADLVFDDHFSPRAEVDSERVRHLREVLESGRALPPIIIDRRNRVVDGYHRARAYLSLRGGDARIPCERREYEDDAAMLLDAIRWNAQHGKPLVSTDQERCVVLARRQGISVERLADILSVRTERIASLAQTKARRAGEAVKSRPLRPRSDFAPITPFDTANGPYGLVQINAVLAGLQNRKIDVAAPEISQSLRNLVKVSLARLKAEEAA